MNFRVPTPIEVKFMTDYMNATQYTRSVEKLDTEASKIISLANSYFRLGYITQTGLDVVTCFINDFKDLMLLRIGK